MFLQIKPISRIYPIISRITDYNSEQDRTKIEKTFMDLMNLADSLDEEEQRYVREGFDSDEELSMYDISQDGEQDHLHVCKRYVYIRY